MSAIRLSQSQFMRQLAKSGLERPSWCEMGSDNRTTPREPVVIDATLRQAKLEDVAVTILDFGNGGCAFASAGKFRVDESFFLHVDALEPVRAHVVWKEDMRFGCRFDRPIHDAVARHLVENLSRKDNRRDHVSRMGRVKTAISR